MAEKKMYAWSPILNPKKNVKLGEAVAKTDLDIEQEDWDYLVESGSVRPTKYPSHDDGSTITRSPTQHVQDQAAKLASGAYVVEPDTAVEEVPTK